MTVQQDLTLICNVQLAVFDDRAQKCPLVQILLIDTVQISAVFQRRPLVLIIHNSIRQSIYGFAIEILKQLSFYIGPS